MKSFYSAGLGAAALSESASTWVARVPVRNATLSRTRSQAASPVPLDPPATPAVARIAIYDHPGAAPRIEEVGAESTPEFIGDVAARVYECARAMGGRVPYSVVREVVENYIHADFLEPVISVMDGGNTLRFSDQGPGFDDSVRALQPGYTTATREMKRHIRGVGSGLPIVKECLEISGGSICIEQNLRRGSVVTLAVPSTADDFGRAGSSLELPAGAALPAEDLRSATLSPDSPRSERDITPRPVERSVPAAASGSIAAGIAGAAAPLFRDAGAVTPPGSALRLTNRQKQVLALVMETGEAGPSLVAKELSVGLSTAYRDLERLESLGLIVSDEAGKRSITDEGAGYLGELLQGLF